MTAPAVAAHGLALAPPPGWDVRIYRRPPTPPESTYAVLHAATFPLPAERADYGDGAVQAMGPTDVFVALVEFEPSATRTALFAPSGFAGPFAGGDFSRTSLQHGMPGQAGLQRFFTARQRAWCLYVVIGSWDRRAELAATANRLVAGIEVGA